MSEYLSGSYDDCLRANTVLLARAQDAEAELTRLRAREAVLVKLLGEAVELIERECGDPDPDRALRGVNRINPDKYYDIAAMYEALATLDVEEKM